MIEEELGGTAPDPVADAMPEHRADHRVATAVADEPAEAPERPLASAEEPVEVPARQTGSAEDRASGDGHASVSAAELDHAPAAAEDEPELPAPPRADRPEPTTMAELLAEQDADIKSFKHGDVVEGSVVRID